MKLNKEILLENGLTIFFYNHTHRYFGDYHRVRVKIICEVPLLEEYFADQAEYAEAKANLGSSVIFRRDTELMGIPSGELEKCLEKVIENFSDNSLSYLSSLQFPQKFVLSELSGSRKKTRKVYPG
jgi:hypothetical protein